MTLYFMSYAVRNQGETFFYHDVTKQHPLIAAARIGANLGEFVTVLSYHRLSAEEAEQLNDFFDWEKVI